MPTKTKKDVGMMKGAHPTAPGGMSQQALADELVEKHGWTEIELDDWRVTTKKGWEWDRKQWPEMIDAVCQARRAREIEAEATHRLAQGLDLPLHVIDPEASLLLSDPETLDYIFDGHAGAGPSASERWLHCTASLGASRKFLETLTPNQQAKFAVANVAARQGTTAHSAAEVEARVMLGELTQDEADLTLMELAVVPETDGEAYDDEMAEYITEYTDLIKSYVDEGREVLIEHRVSAAVPLSGAYEGEVYEIHGSTDCAVLPSEDDNTLVVGDLKYGNGIDVEVDENSQARIYALGVLGALADDEGNLPELDEIIYHIIQPRLGGIKTWSESVDDLLDWRDDELGPQLTKALFGEAEGATYEPSEGACQWCPARGNCVALAEQRYDAGKELFDAIQDAEFEDGPGAMPSTEEMTDDLLGALLTQARGIDKVVKALKEEAERRLHRGKSVPGFHLVNQQDRRKWKPEAAEELIEEERLWKRDLITPTAAEKLLGEKGYAEIEDLVNKPEVRPVIAPVGDRRKAWTGKPPEQMFDELED